MTKDSQMAELTQEQRSVLQQKRSPRLPCRRPCDDWRRLSKGKFIMGSEKQTVHHHYNCPTSRDVRLSCDCGCAPSCADEPEITRWRSVHTAPVGARVLLYGGGPIRFGILDELGNWRATHHGPVKGTPTHWCKLPSPPKDRL